ncbi:MAG: 4Fe-4S domain-containing protein [Propionibacteriaceae bacterium]
MRNGLLTSNWPKRADAYFDDFPSAVGVRSQATRASALDPSAIDQDVEVAAAGCPTRAISYDDRGIRLDRGRCILCGRCVAAAPDVFAWQDGSAVAQQERATLVVGDTIESDEALAALRTALAARVRGLRRSVHVRHVDAGSDGSDEWEVQALTNPVYDLHRLGIFFTASPRHGDILLVTGIGTAEMVDPLHRTRQAMPDPVVVIAAGADAVSGGLIGRGYTAGHGIGGLLDVDVWVPGSPATPFALLHAIMLALGRVPAARTQSSAVGDR